MTFGTFIAAARGGQNSFWRYLVTMLLVVFLVLVGGVCLTLPVVLSTGNAPDLATVLPGPLYLALNLAPFAFIPLGLLIGLRVLHRRPFLSIVNPRLRFNARRFWWGAALWLVFNVAYNLVFALILPGYYTWSFDPLAFLPFLVVLVLLIPIQSGAEELLFRGYLTQAFGRITWWLGWLVPSLLFGLLHGVNPEVGTYGLWLTLPVYVGMGLLFGWITLRTGSLEMALGIHIFNNLYASLITTFPSSALPTQALFTIQNYNALAEMVAFFVVAALMVLAVEVLLRRGLLPPGDLPADPPPEQSAVAISPPSGLLVALLVGGLALGLAGCAMNPAAPAGNTALPLSDCQLTMQGLPSGVKALCGTLNVPENRAQPERRTIALRVAVVKAISRSAAPDPLFLLAGGPGEAASESFAPLLSALDKARFKRDLVLVDQRGTGQSAAFTCLPAGEATATPNPLVTPTPYGEDVPREAALAELSDCFGNMAEADLTQYTTEIAMQDLDDVRAALGYSQINLLGASYGTRAALTYARLFPEHTRSITLDGVVPPGWALGSSVRADAQRALDLIFERCLTDADCNRVFPDFENDFYDLLARLQETPGEVLIPHPTTGEPLRVAMTAQNLAITVRLMSYNDLQVALLPQMIHSAYQGDYALLASQFVLLSGSLGDVNTGLYFAVYCSEDLPNLALEGELGPYYFDPDNGLTRAICGIWQQAAQAGPSLAPTDAPDSAPDDEATPPAGTSATAEGGDYPAPDGAATLDPNLSATATLEDGAYPPPEDAASAVTATQPQPTVIEIATSETTASAVEPQTATPHSGPTQDGAEIDVERSFPRTDIPMLILSGEADPVTPPSNGDEVAALFPNSLHLVLPGMAHVNFYNGCMPTLLRDFLEAGSPLGLNSDCLHSVHPMPFFLSLLGPHPQ